MICTQVGVFNKCEEITRQYYYYHNDPIVIVFSMVVGIIIFLLGGYILRLIWHLVSGLVTFIWYVFLTISVTSMSLLILQSVFR